VACRNCLVNANRIAKLGDFGMTRPVYEKDYYRFHRKGTCKLFLLLLEKYESGYSLGKEVNETDITFQGCSPCAGWRQRA
jgi:hypothetical protein